MRDYSFNRDNRGASLAIIVAIFALFMVLGTSIMMAAFSTNTSLEGEYDSDRINLYVSSVYKTINSELTPELFTTDKQVITFAGFEGGAVTVTTEKNKTVGSAEFIIPYEGNSYELSATYSVDKKVVLVKNSSVKLRKE